MKKRLVSGLGLVLFIFTIGSLVVIKNLNTIVVNQNLINEQDIIIGKYNEMLFQMKGAQAELFRHQAGYTRNIEDLVNYIGLFDENMSFLSRQYTGHIHDVACMQCHTKIEERLTSLKGIFTEINTLIKDYKEDVSIMITTDDENQMRFLESTATQKGNTISGHLEKIRHAADKMREEIKSKRNALINRSQIVIFSTIFLTIVLSLIIFIVLIRGITGPINSLIKGIQRIASGDFSQKVEFRTKDEIGFMAEAFNGMAERLSTMIDEKDRLLRTLQGFNLELERRVKDATDKLRLSQENMARAETLAAIGTLAAGISHEISTPLNTITGFVQLTLSNLDDASTIKGDLKVIEQEALRCRKIVQGLLNFARPQKHEEKLTQINGIINETLSLIEYQPSMRRINIKRDLNRELRPVDSDPLQIKQVFLNLILNAIQAMHEGGELKIVTDNIDSGIMVEVSDTGTGIPEGEVQKIFQPFYTTKKDGTGLGLSISYGIIKEHGGDIYVGTSSDKGTTFKVLLPSQHAAGDYNLPIPDSFDKRG
ncbi:MAG: ATP-binding protein [Nitrospirota bacterium]